MTTADDHRRHDHAMSDDSPAAADAPSRREEPDIAGVVLAGGTSRRMGSDKAMLVMEPTGNETLLERAVGKLVLAGATRIVIATGQAGRLGALPWDEADDGPYAGQGPLAGMAAALQEVRGAAAAMVLAVDHPDASPALLAWLTQQLGATDRSAVLPTDPTGRPQPLHAVYRPAVVAPFLASRLAATPDRRVLTAVAAMGAIEVAPPAGFGSSTWYRNLNEPSGADSFGPGPTDARRC